VFEVIPPTNRYLVDLGAGDGISGSCSRNLIANHGWRGLLVEPDPEAAAQLAGHYQGNASVRTLEAGIYPGDIEIQLARAGVPRDLDLLIVKLSSNDWYVWRAIVDFRPKVVQIEYNAAFLPPQTMVIEYHPLNYWDGTLYFGASIQSLYELGKSKGYELVAVNFRGVNLFFVDRQYYERFHIKDNSRQRLYRPYNYNAPLTPDRLSVVMTEDHHAAPPTEDIVPDEVRIERRFRLDR